MSYINRQGGVTYERVKDLFPTFTQLGGESKRTNNEEKANRKRNTTYLYSSVMEMIMLQITEERLLFSCARGLLPFRRYPSSRKRI